VPGRFEPVRAGGEPAVIVDYAHTPDSLQNVLCAAHEIARGRVICVFGAGGDRDRGKRPLMGEIAARLADVAVVTSDNPRSESPEAIVAEIVAGIPSADPAASGELARSDRSATAEVHVEVDRRDAITWAIEQAHRQDMVVIAGKGHEQGQELAEGVKVPFDDKAVAAEILAAQCERDAVGAQ
jgi:UDP-N-acetylmuramoyl-L-alanyl-D-glutamate--2,6-diaminopimelate ligase